MKYKSAFLTNLNIERVHGRWWKVKQPLVYYSSRIDRIITAPIGFVYNGVSRPIVTYPSAASCIHDLLYRWPVPNISYATADLIFYEAMKAEGDKNFFTRLIKTGTLLAIGWAFKKNMGGCLDVTKNCKGYSAINCFGCKSYYNKWTTCVRKVKKEEYSLLKQK